MSLPNKQTPADFTFKHTGQADKFGNSKGGDVAAVQSDFDARAIDNQNQINAIIDGLKDSTQGQTGAGDIGLNALNVTANTVESGIAENRAAIAETQLGQIADNTLTEAKMAFEMKKQAGGVAEFDTVAALEPQVASNTTALNVSSIFNGLEKDGSGRLTLWENPQTASAFGENVTETYAAIYNDNIDVFIPNANGNFFRGIVLHIRNATNSNRFVSVLLDTRNKRFSVFGTDASGNVKMTQEGAGSSLLINSTDDLGCGTFIQDTAKQYTISFEYVVDSGVPKIRFLVAGLGGGGGYPHTFDFNIAYECFV